MWVLGSALLSGTLAGGVLSLYGWRRVARLQDELELDWRQVADFGAALRQFMQSAGHDPRSLDVMRALAPEVEPLVLGFRPAKHPRVPPGIEPFPPPATAPTGLPRDPIPSLPVAELFHGLDALPGAWADPSTHPDAARLRDRVESLRGQVLGAEWLLQSEMKALGRAAYAPGTWPYQGVAGLLLLLIGRAGGATPEERTRRRALETDPRFVRSVQIAWGLVLLAGILLLQAVVWPALFRLFSPLVNR